MKSLRALAVEVGLNAGGPQVSDLKTSDFEGHSFTYLVFDLALVTSYDRLSKINLVKTRTLTISYGSRLSFLYFGVS